MSGNDEKTTVENVNVPGKTSRVNAAKTDALAWLDCAILSRHAAGAHSIYVVEVQASHVPRPDEPPLVYWNPGYRQLKLRDRE